MLRVKVKVQGAVEPVGNEMEVVRADNAPDKFDLEDVATVQPLGKKEGCT